MTISSQTRKAGPYIGAGTTSTFPFAFKVFQASDVLVVKLDTATNIETVLTLTSNYTVALNADQNSNPGGNITLIGGALATGFNLVISSQVPYTQGTDITNMGGFYPEVIENALDKLCIDTQQLKLDVDRSAKLPITSTQDADALVADIIRLADSADNIDTVAGSITNVNTVATNIANVNAVGNNISNVNAVAANETNINAVKNNSANINTVAGKTTEITTVSTNINNVNTVAGNTTNINTVAGNTTNINTVATNIAAVNNTSTNMAAVIDAPTQAANAAASAAAAAASAAAGMYSAVQDKSADYTVVLADAGDLLRVTSSTGNRTITLPAISGLPDGFNVTVVKWSGDANTVTIQRSGSDLINGSTSYVLDAQYKSATFVADKESSTWFASGSGSASTNIIVDTFTGNGSQTAFTLSGDPGSKNNTLANVGGTFQLKSAYTQVGSVITFSSAPPNGVPIEIQWSQPLAIGTPADSTVSTVKLADGALAATTTGRAKMADGFVTQQKLDASIGTSASQAEMEAGTLADLRLFSPLRVAQAVQALALNSTYYDQSALFSGSQTSLVLPNINVIVNSTLVRITGTTLALGTAGNWDSATYATAANRAGKDFYVYALQAGGVILSANSTYPTGYTAANSRKIGGFHCLCVAVGTISGHTLSGYVAGDILPRSVWDRYNRSSATQEGRVLSRCGKWVMIYLPSVSGSALVSVNNGTIADGASSPAFHAYKFEQWLARQGEMSISQLEFFAASDGANQGTNITGSVDPGTTTGHTDTAGRRMISNEGVEDTCGVLWQWTRDQGGNMTGAAWANAYDGNDSGVGGQHYQAPFRGLLGGIWNYGVICGSRGSIWNGSPLSLASDCSVRGVAEPAVNRF